MAHLVYFWHALCRHKYLVTSVLFLLMLTFVDDDSFVVRYQRRVEIGQLQQEIDKFSALYEDETARLEALDNDPQAVERLARERYRMKRANEDIYIIGEKEAGE